MSSFTEPDTLFKTIKNLVREEINRVKGIDIWKVTSLNVDDYTVNISHVNFQNIQYDRVPMMSMGLGHFKGVMNYPEVDDLVIVGFIGKGEDVNPIILGTIFDVISQGPDQIPQIEEGEYLIRNKTLGSNIFINKNNEIIIKVADSSGDLNAGARIKLKNDGSFKLFNKDNYGIECDSSGGIIVRGTTVDFTTSAGTF